MINSERQRVSGKPGQTVLLMCKVTSSPVGRVRWYRNSTLLVTLNNGEIEKSKEVMEDSSRFYYYQFDHKSLSGVLTEFEATFRLDDSETFGWYRCIAENDSGASTVSVEIVNSGR